MISLRALGHHLAMLSDPVRVDAYQRAIEAVVCEGDRVADLGAGLGVLSSIACSAGAGIVHAVEFDSETAGALSRAAASGSQPIEVIAGRSFDTLLDPAPDVVVTETIGAICFEEHIVEITYDFTRRHPGVRSIVPASISLWAAAVRAEERGPAARLVRAVRDLDLPDYEALIVEELTAQRPPGAPLANGVLQRPGWLGPAQLLHRTVLGHDRSSQFSRTLELTGVPGDAFIAVWFEADLAPGVILTNRPDAPLTHWRHNYVARAPGARAVTFSYDPFSARLSVDWDA